MSDQPPFPGSQEPPPPPAAAGARIGYGGFGLRLVARILDGLILGIPLGLLFALMAGVAATGVSVAVDANGNVNNVAAGGVGGLLVLWYLALFVCPLDQRASPAVSPRVASGRARFCRGYAWRPQ